MLKGAFGLNRCRRCGVILSWKKVPNLWCSKCIKEVDKELNHIQNKPYDYYFKWYIEHKDEKEKIGPS